MARVTIEEKWWSDPRRMKLILKIGFAADAAAVNVWRLAQEWWAAGRQLIPLEIFEQAEYGAELIECGLAVVRDRSVYVRGSSAFLDWVREQREVGRINGKKGGKASAEARRKKYGTAQPKPKNLEPPPNTPSNELPNARSESNPSGSGSGSGSDSGSGISIPTESTAPPGRLPAEKRKANFLIARYCDLWKATHGSSPDITGKDAGIAKRLAKGIGAERLDRLLEAYFGMPDAWLEKRKHPLELFEAKLKEVAAFADSGKFVSASEVRQRDNSTALTAQLGRIEGGSL